MYNIVFKQYLNDTTVHMRVLAPAVAKKALPGQFVIVHLSERSERVPLTVAEYDREEGTVGIIFQMVGATTMELGRMEEGQEILDFVGPLGTPSELGGYRKVAVIGGGLGCAIAYPQAKYLHDHGAEVDMIAGFRTADLIILQNEMAAGSNHMDIVTDDGSNGRKGLVTDALRERIEVAVAAGCEPSKAYDLVIAIGPPVMMKFVCQLTKQYGIKTVVSMNPIMVDGTGMCGGCRVTVGGKIKFACIDGPDFDGHLVDFDELIRRNAMYKPHEEHACNLMRKADEIK